MNLLKQQVFKIMKTKLLMIVAAFAVGLVFTSCEKDEEIIAKPEINNLELGLGDSHIGYIGSDLHMEAEILAEGKIDVVTVEIHSEDGSGEEIEASFDDYSGQLNATFHKHVDIPAEMEEGEYHFHLSVVDMLGNTTEIEEELTLEIIVDEEAPELTITAAPDTDEVFTDGETISISGTITDNFAVAGMLVALVREEDNIADSDVGGSNTSVIVMMHTHDFDDPDEVEFTASIEVGAENDNNMEPAPIQGDNAWQSGNYYLLVKGKDANSNGFVSAHYPIVLDY